MPAPVRMTIEGEAMVARSLGLAAAVKRGSCSLRLGRLFQIGDYVRTILLVGETREGHACARYEGLGPAQELVQRLFRPGDAGVLHRGGVGVARDASGLAAEQADVTRPNEIVL